LHLEIDKHKQKSECWKHNLHKKYIDITIKLVVFIIFYIYKNDFNKENYK